MDVSPTTTGPTPTTSPPSVQSAGVISSDFETFLKMLTVQMQNQDPLDPIKSEDYAVQLATFSGVEQQVRTNELIAAMGAQLGMMGMSQFAGWVGMQARAPVAAYFDGTPIALSANPPAMADRVELIVRDFTGQAVDRRPVPNLDGPLEWDGVAADGSRYLEGLYSFEFESFSNGVSLGSAPAEPYSIVTEARVQDGQTMLILRGGIAVPADQVTALRDPALVA